VSLVRTTPGVFIIDSIQIDLCQYTMYEMLSDYICLVSALVFPSERRHIMPIVN
jgi:hypothetical protein